MSRKLSVKTPAFEQDGVRVFCGDCVDVMRVLPERSVRTCVTSPPYWGLRDYGVDGQIGLELTPDEYVARIVEVFREVRRLLTDDGTCWINLGDCYAGSGRGGNPARDSSTLQGGKSSQDASMVCRRKERGSLKPAGFHESAVSAGQLGRAWVPPPNGLKSKDLIGIPWMVAFALRADGWYLRQDIICSKPNPMPESVEDRCTKSHEYIFLLSKKERYYFDHAAISEPVAESTIERMNQPSLAEQAGSLRVPGKTNGAMKAVVRGRTGRNAFRGQGHFKEGNGPANRSDRDMRTVGADDTRNKRSVWNVSTKPFSGAHFATFPPDLITPCILAGSRPDDLVLDPFNGSGTTAHVCREYGRRYIGIELNPDYIALTRSRFKQPLLFVPTAKDAI